MCRYAMVSYKPHFACFNCRKTFKRRLLNDVDRDETESVAAKCPECGQLMADMGLDFESPKKKDVKAWEHLKTLYAVGITFHSCGCSGPGYIPSSTEALVAYFTNILMTYHAELNFWRNRTEPTTESEMAKELNKNGGHIMRVPFRQNIKNGPIKNEEAKAYWYKRIEEVQKKLDLIDIK